jgi:hypothetical protein
VFAAIGGCVALLPRCPRLAGALLALSWVKPQISLPAAALVILFHPPFSRRLAAGFSAATICLVSVSGLHDIRTWFNALTGYSNDIAVQPNLSSLSGLYATSTSAEWRAVFAGTSILVAALLTGVVWYRSRRLETVNPVNVAWLWFVWFLASPYAHYPDQVVLTLPVVALLGRNARQLITAVPLAVLYLLISSIIVFPSTASGINLLCVPVAISAALAYVAMTRHAPEYD